MKNDTDTLEKLGKNLSRLRKIQKLSFRKMAQKCDTDYSDIKKYELGKTNLTLLKVEDLAMGLGIEIIELLNPEFSFSEERLQKLIAENKAIKLIKKIRINKSKVK